MPNVPIAGGEHSVSGVLCSEAAVHPDEKALKTEIGKNFEIEEDNPSLGLIPKKPSNVSVARETSGQHEHDEPMKSRRAADTAASVPRAVHLESFEIFPVSPPDGAKKKRSRQPSSPWDEVKKQKKPHKERVPLMLGSPRLKESGLDTHVRSGKSEHLVNKDAAGISDDHSRREANAYARVKATGPRSLFFDAKAPTHDVAPRDYGFFPDQWQSQPGDTKTIHSRRKNENITPLDLRNSGLSVVPNVQAFVPAPLFANTKVNAPKHAAEPSFKPQQQEASSGANVKVNQQRYYKSHPVTDKGRESSNGEENDGQLSPPQTPPNPFRQQENLIAPIPIHPLPPSRIPHFDHQAHARNPSTSSTSYTPHPAYQNTTTVPGADPSDPPPSVERYRIRSRTIPLQASETGSQVSKPRRKNTDAETGVGAWWNFKIGNTTASNISAHVRNFSGSASKKIMDQAVNWGVGRWAGQTEAGSPAVTAGIRNTGGREQVQSFGTAHHSGQAHERDMSVPTGVTGSAERAGAANTFTTAGGMSPRASVETMAKPETVNKTDNDELAYPLGQFEEDWKGR